MALTEAQEQRYRRSILLPDIGVKGQEQLGRARVAVIGAGGLGSAALLHLAAAGIGRLEVVDGDRVELSNLQRQTLYRSADVGRLKASAAAGTLRALNPELAVVARAERLGAENARALVRGMDVVVDAVDTQAVRYLVNDACLAEGVPLVEAGIGGTGGFVTTILPGRGPCLRCVFPEPEDGGAAAGSRLAGVFGPAPGVLGAVEAAEALKVVLGRGDTLCGKLLLLDLWTNDFRVVETAAAPGCPGCGSAG
jgi:adenylyltransferase/sulfurtransferase